MKVSIPKNYIHGRDPRTQEEIEKHSTEIKNICSLNEILFKPLIDQESKKEIQKVKNKNLEMKLSGGRYVTYTDRISQVNQTDRHLPVFLTIHGVPGTLYDFLNLQQSVQSRLSCRWINLSLPGLDGKDERRGTFQGYLEDTTLLIKDLLDELKAEKVILIMHSAGGMYAKHFAYTYPEKVKALVQLASIGLEMWQPILNENQLFSKFGIDVNRITREEIENERFRVEFSEKVKAFAKNFENTTDKSLLVWKQLIDVHHMMLLKAQLVKGGFDQFFQNLKNIDRRIPRFFAYSSIDTLIEEKHIQQEIEHSILSPFAFQFKLKQNSNFDKVLTLRDKEHTLKNFIFQYSDSGHALQHHKAQDISIKLVVFVQMLDEIEPLPKDKQVQQLKPKL